MWRLLLIILLAYLCESEGHTEHTMADGSTAAPDDRLNITNSAPNMNNISTDMNQVLSKTLDGNPQPEVVQVTPAPSNESAAMKRHKALLAFVKAASKYATYQASLAVNRYMLSTVVVFGTVGNILSLLVMLQPANRKTPLCVYMTGLAINDLCMLLGLGLYSWLVHEVLPMRPLPNVECQSGVYFYSVFSINGVLIITVMTIERFVAIRYPLMAASWLSARRACISLACLTIFSVIFCVPQWLYTLTLANNLCQAFAYTDVFSNIYSWVYLTFNSFLPFSIILILNIYIVNTLRQSRKFRTGFSNAHGQSQNDMSSDVTKRTSISQSQISVEVGTQTNSADIDSHQSGKEASLDSISCEGNHSINDGCPASGGLHTNDVHQLKKPANRDSDFITRERQLTAMLVLVSLALLVFTIPQCVRYVLTNLYSYTTTPEVWANFMLLYSTTNKVFFVNNAINFYLYCLSGSRFRGDILKLFTCKKK